MGLSVCKCLVRDLIAAAEIHRNEPRAPFCVHAQPRATDAMRAPPALQHGPRVEQGGPHAEHLPARRQQRARLPQHAEICDRAPCGRDREQHVLQGLPRPLPGVRRSGVLGAWIHPVEVLSIRVSCSTPKYTIYGDYY